VSTQKSLAAEPESVDEAFEEAFTEAFAGKRVAGPWGSVRKAAALVSISNRMHFRADASGRADGGEASR